MTSLAAKTAKAYRRSVRSGKSWDVALDRATPVEIVECFPGYNQTARNVVIKYASTYPMESSASLLFPDDSILILANTEAYVARVMNLAEDKTVHAYSDDLIPTMPLERYRRRFYPARYPFTEPERQLVNGAIQLMDTVLVNAYGLQLVAFMKWFPLDRLLVKNLIAAGGREEAICSLLLGMIFNGRPMTLLEQAVVRDEAADELEKVTIRHQMIP